MCHALLAAQLPQSHHHSTKLQLTPVVSKASAGAMESARLFSTPSLVDFIREIKSLGAYSAVGADARGSGLLSWKGPGPESEGLVVAVGSERGMSNQLKQACDELIAIQPGGGGGHAVDSLNVSVACGILIHHLVNRL